MGLEMPFDFVRPAEAFATHRATVWLLPSMDPHVYLQVSHLCEAFSTNLAAEWFFSRVAPLVLLESSRGAAALPAYTTAVRFLSRVHLHMHMEVADMTKRLTANFAAEGRHVALQGGFLMGAVNSIGSLVAHVRGLSSVSSSSCSLSTNHLSSILHPNNVNIILIRAVWVDWCKGLGVGATIGRRGASVASSAFYLHMP